MIEETWDARELPILVAVYRARDEGRDLNAAASHAVPDLVGDRYMQTISDHANAGYLDVAFNRGGAKLMNVWIRDLTPRGLRAVGAWPSGKMVDAFLKALEERAQSEQDEQKKNVLLRLLELSYDVGKGALAAILAKVLTRGL